MRYRDTGVSSLGPEPGDLLVSRGTATREYLVTIIPTSDCVLRGIANSAVTAGLDLAQQLGVDLWLTDDHIYFLRLAAFRSLRQRPVDLTAN
jgi:hypothetical protein